MARRIGQRSQLPRAFLSFFVVVVGTDAVVVTVVVVLSSVDWFLKAQATSRSSTDGLSSVTCSSSFTRAPVFSGVIASKASEYTELERFGMQTPVARPLLVMLMMATWRSRFGRFDREIEEPLVG